MASKCIFELALNTVRLDLLVAFVESQAFVFEQNFDWAGSLNLRTEGAKSAIAERVSLRGSFFVIDETSMRPGELDEKTRCISERPSAPTDHSSGLFVFVF